MSERNPFEFTRSQSQRATYRRCPRLWFHRYVSRWKQKQRKAQWEFGNVMEKIAEEIVTGRIATRAAAAMLFRGKWEPLKDDPTLTFSTRASHKILLERGIALSELAVDELPRRLDANAEFQRELRYDIDTAKELCYLDYLGLVSPRDGDPWSLGVVDFKTADRKVEEFVLENDEQTTDYQLAVSVACGKEVAWLGLCRFIWSASPCIQWVWQKAHERERLSEFISGAKVTNEQINRGEFPRYTHACNDFGGCWARPLCFPTLADRIDAELVNDSNSGELVDNELRL